ncbi:hypothetical protein R1flu_022783 [Riccia fluitans]|uniref:FKB95-like N-terminal Kelch domain-containing protein n=1 Tax=Riccia fluitans TaxID=41844 RepID=A0ABD1XQ81_9MARC
MMNVEVLSPVSSAPWLRKGGPRSMGFDGLIEQHTTSRPFGRLVESVSWYQLAEREVVKSSKSWHDFTTSLSTVSTYPLKPSSVQQQPAVKNLTIHVEETITSVPVEKAGLYDVEGIESYCSKFEDASLIPGIPDDVAKSCLALIPREDFPSVRRVNKAWLKYVQSRESYITRKNAGTLEEWLYMLTVTPDKKYYVWEVLNPKLKEWKSLPCPPEVRDGGKTVVFNEKLMHIGGMSRSDGKVASTDVFVYCPITDRWVEGASLNEPRYQHACGVVDGKLYVLGGYGPNEKGISSMEVYDPEKNEWKLSTPLKRPRWGCFAAGVEGKLYVLGGRSSFTPGYYRYIDVYDPKIGKWTELKNGCQMVLTHAVIKDKIYCMEWKDERSLKVYNTTDNTWTKVHIPLPCKVRENFCLGTFRGKLLLFPSSSSKSIRTLMFNPEAAEGSEWEPTDISGTGPCLGCAALTA